MNVPWLVLLNATDHRIPHTLESKLVYSFFSVLSMHVFFSVPFRNYRRNPSWCNNYLCRKRLFVMFQLLMDPLVLSVLYVWCQVNKDMIVQFWFGMQFKVRVYYMEVFCFQFMEVSQTTVDVPLYSLLTSVDVVQFLLISLFPHHLAVKK